MATPHVAGAWALIKQAIPGGSVTDILAALQSTGESINTTCPSPTGSVPRIQIDAAITALVGSDSLSAPLLVANLDADPREDLVVNFESQFGLWVFYNNTTWAQIHGTNADSLAIGNIDGVGGDDIVCTFGTYGTWVFYNNATWAQINGTNADSLAIGNIDGDAGGKDDIVCTFDTYGTWIYYNNAAWTQINGNEVGALAVGNIDGDTGGKADIACTFGAYGTWMLLQ